MIFKKRLDLKWLCLFPYHLAIRVEQKLDPGCDLQDEMCTTLTAHFLLLRGPASFLIAIVR